jgi:hypothetical protein
MRLSRFMGFLLCFRDGSDHQHCPLLRSRRERPRDCHATEQRDSRRPMKKVI